MPAIFLLFEGRFEQAFTAAQAALRADRTQTHMILVLATIALEYGNHRGAQDLVGMARTAGETDGWADVIEGRIALDRHDFPRARSAARRATIAPIAFAPISDQAGVLLSRCGFHEDAVPLYRRAVAGAPDRPEFRYNLAVALHFVGESAASQRLLRTLVNERPGDSKSWLALIQMTDRPQKEWLSKLETQFAADRSPDGRLRWGHAIARLCELAGDWDGSFAWLERAKAARLAETAYDRSAAHGLFAAAAQSAQGPFPAHDAAGRPALFVCGLPRTGTSLVERIVGAHPAVQQLGELPDLGIVMKRASAAPGPLVVDAQTVFAASQISNPEVAGHEYLTQIAQIAPGSSPFTDKMPFNIFFAPAILRALPAAKVICLRRSPPDAVAASYRQIFSARFPYYDYALSLDDTAHFIAGFENITNSFAKLLPRDRFMTVSYEDLVGDPARMTRRMLEFCGLGWRDECLDFHTVSGAVATPSGLQVRRPVNRDGIARWRQYPQACHRIIAALNRYGIAQFDGPCG